MTEDEKNYGPLAFLIGKWDSGDICTGENRAPSPDRVVENTKFKQVMTFVPAGEVKNHEQVLYGLRYITEVWEEGDDETFHEEVGYWIYDRENKQVMKSFAVPRGISVLAGGMAEEDATAFEMTADVGNEIYGICSNKFLDQEFKTVRYELKINKIDENTFSYDEDSHLKIKSQPDIFHHTEINIMKRV